MTLMHAHCTNRMIMEPCDGGQREPETVKKAQRACVIVLWKHLLNSNWNRARTKIQQQKKKKKQWRIWNFKQLFTLRYEYEKNSKCELSIREIFVEKTNKTRHSCIHQDNICIFIRSEFNISIEWIDSGAHSDSCNSFGRSNGRTSRINGTNAPQQVHGDFAVR